MFLVYHRGTLSQVEPLLSLRTIVHVYKVVHKFYIKLLSLVNRFIGICQFEIWNSRGIDVNSCKGKIIRHPPSLLVKACHVIGTLRSFAAQVWCHWYFAQFRSAGLIGQFSCEMMFSFFRSVLFVSDFVAHLVKFELPVLRNRGFRVFCSAFPLNVKSESSES